MRMLRSAGNLEIYGEEVSRETALYTDTVKNPSKTIQSGKDEADINVIVRRFGVTGQLPAGVRMPSYGDYVGVADFQSAMNAVRSGEESFMLLPSNIRAQFGNSPQAFLEFVSKKENADEMVKMGLAIKRKPDIITPADVPLKEKVDEQGNSSKRAGKAGKAVERSDGDSGDD